MASMLKTIPTICNFILVLRNHGLSKHGKREIEAFVRKHNKKDFSVVQISISDQTSALAKK